MSLIQGTIYPFYYCQGRLRGLGCTRHALPYKALEAAFKILFLKVPALLASNTDNSTQAELEALQGKLITTETQIANITEAVKQGKATGALTIAQAELESEVEEIKASIEQAQAKSGNYKTDEQQAKKILASLDSLAADMGLRRQVREWIFSNVEKMVFNGDKQQFAIQFRKGVRALYQFKNKYTEGEATFIPDFPKA
jgi:hypothetical protein